MNNSQMCVFMQITNSLLVCMGLTTV